VEEWGYALGEDTCLFEEESDSEASQSDHEEGHGDPNVGRNVDTLIKKIADGLEAEDFIELQEKHVDQHSNKQVDDEDRHVGEEIVIPSPVGDPFVIPTTLGTDIPVGSGVRDQGTGDSPQLSGVQGSSCNDLDFYDPF
ncbi:hypothetical protein A2U01_0054392, partial [Trifolium medium]|nr:hypothetical protein [Trifolium medium]